MEFFILRKPFLMDKTRTVRQIWLVNELVLFSGPFQSAIQSEIILLKVIVFTDDDDDRQTDRQTPS